MLDNKAIIENTLMVILRVIATSTSVNYALSMLNTFFKRNSNEFSFVQYIKINKINDVVASEEINSVEPKKIAKMINQLLGILFLTDQVRQAIIEGMDQELLSDLEGFGVMI